MNELAAGIDLIAIFLCVLFLAYVVVILVPYLRRKPDRPGLASDFEWHLLVPCLDEEVVIARTVTRLRTDHPGAHVWCIDDDSADSTLRILTDLAAEDPGVHVVSRKAPVAQQGKGAALNAAWCQLTEWLADNHPDLDPNRVVVGVVDADGRLAPDALDVIAGPDGFGDARIGAVQIQVRMMNRGLDRIDASDPAAQTRFQRLLVTLQDLEFRTVIAAMQYLRHRIGSAGMGGNGQFSRLAVLNEIATENRTPWHGALLEDFELGLHVLLAGHGNRYCDDTWVAQEGLPKVNQLLRQRARWAQGGMQCAKYFRQVLLSPRISTPSALEISYFLLIPWTQLLGSIVYPAAAVVMGYFALTSPGGVGAWFVAGAWGTIPLMIAFGVAPVVVWGLVYRSRCEPTLSRLAAVGLGLAYLGYMALMLGAVWRAFGRMVRARDGWVKTSRVLAVPAAEVRPAAESAPEPARDPAPARALAPPRPASLPPGRPASRPAARPASRPVDHANIRTAVMAAAGG